MTRVRDDADYDKELLVRVPRGLKIKSGFAVEKGDDGYYYFTAVGLDCDEIQIEDRLQEVNGIQWEDFEDEVHANEILNDPALRFLYFSILSKSNQQIDNNNGSGGIDLDGYETASEYCDNIPYFVSKVTMDDLSSTSYESLDYQAFEGELDEQDKDSRNEATHSFIIENVREVAEVLETGNGSEDWQLEQKLSTNNNEKGIIKKKETSPRVDVKEPRISSVKIESDTGVYDLSPSKNPSTRRWSVKIERNIGVYDLTPTKTLSSHHPSGKFEGNIETTGTSPTKAATAPFCSPSRMKGVRTLPKPVPGDGWNKVAFNHKLSGQSLIY